MKTGKQSGVIVQNNEKIEWVYERDVNEVRGE
jgi:hypothetical protein